MIPKVADRRAVHLSGVTARALDVLVTFLRLGCTSFGGPVAHLAYFRHEFVERRKWLDDQTFGECVALAQLLPGPGSSQTGMLLGWIAAGPVGAICAWIGFTAPSAVLMTLFSLAVPGSQMGAGWLHGLLLVAVAVVANAIVSMRIALAPDTLRIAICIAIFALVLFVPYPAITPLAIGIAALAGTIVLYGRTPTATPKLDLGVRSSTGGLLLALFAVALAVLGLWARRGAHAAVLANTLFRTGSLVFGGGHIVLPLLQSQAVSAGILDQRTILAGYGAAQAMPGPLFTIASFVGASAYGRQLGVVGALIGTVAIFLPSFLLIGGVAPFYRSLASNERFRAALAGANAGVVGVLAAAFVTPIWHQAVHTWVDVLFVAIAFAAIALARVPSWAIVGLGALAGFAIGATPAATVLLPSGWTLTPPRGDVATTGTMPQGMAISPGGSELAVVEAGFNPPALRVLDAQTLRTIKLIPLKDAFGSPVWTDDSHVLVPGASTNGLLHVDIATGRVTVSPAHLWTVAVATVAGSTVSLGDRSPSHPAAIVARGSVAYIAEKGESSVTVVRGGQRAEIPVDLHPAALAFSADGTKVYVACADADAVDVIDTAGEHVVGRIKVGLPQGQGASPNALALAEDGTLYVSLGAENAVAQIRGGRVTARMPAGWYPDALAIDGDELYIANGRGESSPANPDFDPESRHGDSGYVAAAVVGSVRKVNVHEFDASSTAQVIANLPASLPAPVQTVVRAGGPIRHVIYIIKENRTYDQVLGDIPGADGDPKLAWFGEKVTPNDHAIVRRFGIFDDTYTDAQVSANGHNWSTAAFANDYVERFWPPNYGGRRPLYDFEGDEPTRPGTGYLWDDADAHGVSLRDYGEFVTELAAIGPETTQMPGLQGRIDPHYIGWDLDYSDEQRVDEWQREFKGFVANRDLPGLEIVRLPNDHTYATTPGKLTPQAYAAQNDHALGRIVDTVSHSPYWASTAIFAIEDDSQNGPDHVDDQRTTFYLASAYAKPGVHHQHYSTTSVIRTIELLLGLPPMNIYDAMAPPMYDAFALAPDLRPYDVLPERIDVNAVNAKTAYGAQISRRLDFRHADANDPAILNQILAHSAGY
jgi:putative chromate ion transporter